jgi:flagellin-like protein
MRGISGVLGLLIVMAVVALLAKKQLGAVSVTAPGISVPASGTTPQQQGQQIQKQIGQAVENSLQQTRPMPDDK